MGDEEVELFGERGEVRRGDAEEAGQGPERAPEQTIVEAVVGGTLRLLQRGLGAEVAGEGAILKETWQGVDTILMGRRTWDFAVRSGGGGGGGGGKIRTCLFSRTLTEAPKGAELVRGDAAGFVRALKGEQGGIPFYKSYFAKPDFLDSSGRGRSYGSMPENWWSRGNARDGLMKGLTSKSDKPDARTD